MIKSGVYKILNLQTGRFYIGSAIDLAKRKSTHFNNRLHNSRLKKSFEKYGNKNFSWIILEYCKPEQCLIREQYYLDTLLFAQEYIKTHKKDKRFLELGYNFSPTSTSRLGVIDSKETRQRKSICKLNIKQTPSHIQKRLLSKAITILQRQTLLKQKQPKIEIVERGVIQYSSEGFELARFISIKQANLLTGVEYNGISRCCRYKSKSTRGYKWTYIGESLKLEIKKESVRSKPVIQFSKLGVYITRYSSITQASDYTGIKKSDICAVCKDKLKTAGKFKWAYEEFYNIGKQQIA